MIKCSIHKDFLMKSKSSDEFCVFFLMPSNCRNLLQNLRATTYMNLLCSKIIKTHPKNIFRIFFGIPNFPSSEKLHISESQRNLQHWILENTEKITKNTFFVSFENFSTQQMYTARSSLIFRSVGAVWTHEKKYTKLVTSNLLVNIFWKDSSMDGQIELDFRIFEHLWEVVIPLLGGVGWQMSILDLSTHSGNAFSGF